MIKTAIIGLVVLGFLGVGAVGTMMVPGFGHHYGSDHMGYMHQDDCFDDEYHSFKECENHYEHYEDCEEHHEYYEHEMGQEFECPMD